jgi:hypothetical protein
MAKIPILSRTSEAYATEQGRALTAYNLIDLEVSPPTCDGNTLGILAERAAASGCEAVTDLCYIPLRGEWGIVKATGLRLKKIEGGEEIK